MPAPAAAPFAQVLSQERDEIDASRRLRGQPPLLNNPDLSALAFSGGGIRSAVFNLGILQGLARRGLIRQLDYLSTVSGGGYISAWLLGWIRRAGSRQVEQRLRENSQPPPPSEAGRYLEPDQVRFLRRYATYLAPRSGMLSADTWSMLAIYLRNLILNLTLLVVFGAGVLLVPDLVLWLTRFSRDSESWLWEALFAVLVFSAVTVGIGLGGLANDSPARRGWRRVILYHEGSFTSLPLFTAAFLGSLLLRGQIAAAWRDPSAISLRLWIWGGALLYTGAWILALWVRYINKKGQYPQPIAGGLAGWSITIAATIVAGMLQGYLVYWVARLLIFLFHQGSDITDPQWLRAMPLVFGPPLLVGTLLLAVVFHIGLAGRAAPDALREWAARAAAILSLVTVGWIALFGASLYGPPLIRWLTTSDWAVASWGSALKWIAASAWAAVSAGGVLAGKSSATKGNDGSLGWLAKIAPPIFIVGFVLLLSYGLDVTLTQISSRNPAPAAYARTQHVEGMPSMQPGAASQTSPSRAHVPRDMHYFAERHWNRVQTYLDGRLVLYLLVCIVLVLTLEWRVDVNEFSMHLFYRNRLTRTFLGASQSNRISDPFTGFSEDDDIALKDLTTGVPRWREPVDPQTLPEPENGRLYLNYDGPFPLFCTALNEVKGKELAWRTRKAASFIYSPLYCGYDYFADQREPLGKYSASAYRPTAEYSRKDGPTVGTAIAISGAAASPNMGYHTSPALGFMMTVFNVRLGWWAGNPRHPQTWRRYGPWWGLLYLLKEVFPNTSDETAYVYLSDGGHFENLGVYELVRRQCRYIVCCDADCDPAGSFDNLGALVEKCRSDFGVNIEIDVSKLKHDPARISQSHFAVGTIHYRNGVPGYLLYIKPTLTGDEPEDVQAYAAKNGAFPHDTTGNQFFDESQFESYRALGEHILTEILSVATRPTGTTQAIIPFTIAAMFSNLRQP